MASPPGIDFCEASTLCSTAAMLLPEDRPKRRRIWIAGLSALLALSGVCVWTTAVRIPQEISARAAAALQIAGIAPRVALAVDGRTLILSGELADAYTRARALAVAGSIRGAHAVVDRIRLTPAQTASAERSDPVRIDAPGPPPAALPGEPPAKTAPSESPAAAGHGATLPLGTTNGGQAENTAATGTGARPSPDTPEAPPPARLAETPAQATPAPAAAPRTPENPDRPAALPPKVAVLLFGFDSAHPNPESEPLLQEAIALLKQRPGLRVEVAGHTDSSGAPLYNQRLSERRAAAIANRMIAAGVDAAQLQTRGYGETQPRAGNHLRQGRLLNRRVEITAIP
ncbi:MAG: OmpA family protein [Desulfobacterales bacterium]